MKKIISAILKQIKDKRMSEVIKMPTSLYANIKYNIVKAIDWSFKPFFDLSMSIVALLIFSIILCFFNREVGVFLLLTSLILCIVYVVVGAVVMFAEGVNRLLFFYFTKLFKKYYN